MTSYVHPLTNEEIQALEQQHRQTKDAPVRSRCELIFLSNEGLTPPRIAERVRFSARTVRRNLDRYEAAGLTGLRNRPIAGRPARVTADYLVQLEQVVEQNPRDLNLPLSNWTTANLAEYMGQQTGVIIGARQMENYLKAQDWRLRRPVRTVKHKQDTQLVQAQKNA